MCRPGSRFDSTPGVAEAAFREQLHLGVEVDVPAVDRCQAPRLQDPQRQACEVLEQRDAGLVVRRVDYEAVDRAVRHVGPHLAQVAEAQLISGAFDLRWDRG